jgi:hypothetical protein
MDITVLLWVLGAFLLGIALVKLIPIFKDKKITDDEKEIFEDIIINIIKDALKLTTITTEEEIIDYAQSKVLAELKVNGINSFTAEEVEIAVRLLIKAVKDGLK